ncbi:KOW domain-containing RNA-binding protein [Natribacillus halophilus]|uniref:Ribosomal protein L14E/L6E/L27E n=1 Tax=Natribacillus halophilus TaxID=549003 RepID=A0A1G8QUH2_9BACI|nr:KOW domain-containing RNA-binding protein [Natribacillus halophilus]SDJ08409.1 hypothetical protein SAMN04488123_11422 [Natribacillus halophilus]
MRKAASMPELGEVVQTLTGRESQQFFIVIAIVDEHFVLLADGNRRMFKRAKKKNINHIRPCTFVSREVKNSLEETGRVTNAKLRHGLMQFRREQPDIRKGGE